MAVMGQVRGGAGSYQSKVEKNLSCPSDGQFDVGFKPKKLSVSFQYNTNNIFECIYDADATDPTKYIRRYVYNGTYGGSDSETLADTPSLIGLAEVNANGFKITTAARSSTTNFDYIAIG